MYKTVIHLRVQPATSKNIIDGRYGNSVRVKITAAPEQGKANAALVDLLSDKLKIAKSAIEIIRGHSSRNKVVVINGIEEDEVLRCLLAED
jgi:uncharacterized protein (TIGR00251 family)